MITYVFYSCHSESGRLKRFKCKYCSLSLQARMALLLWLSLSLLASYQSSAVKNCHPGCRCEVESFGLFDSFSLTRVDCRGLGPSTAMPIPIPLDTSHLDLSSITMGPLSDTMLAGPGYTTLVSLDLSSNHITKVSGWWTFFCLWWDYELLVLQSDIFGHNWVNERKYIGHVFIRGRETQCQINANVAFRPLTLYAMF